MPHVILEQSPVPDSVTASVADTPADAGDGPVAWVLSGRTPEALAGQAGRLSQYLLERPDVDPVDVARTLAGRTRFEQRAVVVGGDRAALSGGLAAVAQGLPAEGVESGTVRAHGKTVLVFPGQGAQWLGMCRDCRPGSRRSRRRWPSAIGHSLIWWIGRCWTCSLPMMRRGSNTSQIVQPVLFAVMVSLAELWRSVGVEADAVVGHSQGEIAAAHVAGGLSLENAARIVIERSAALTVLAGQGAMVSVFAPRDRVEELLDGFDGLAVAVVNGPGSTVVSGATGPLESLLSECERRGIRARRVAVDYASHSPQVEKAS
nr:acyltransferase domain-containing protein [Nocardia tengchongensis]